MNVVGLSERCDFQLHHCGQPMEWVGASTTWTGKPREGTEQSTTRYLCPACESTAQVSVTEVGV